MKKNHLTYILIGLAVIILIAAMALWFYEPAPGSIEENSWVPPDITPGSSHLNTQKLVHPSTVELKAGETVEENITLETRTSGPGMVHYSVSSRVKADYPKEEPPWPDGLNISIEPSDFMAYPNETYISILTVTTTPDLLQGEYVFRLGFHFEGVAEGGGWITVIVD
jgi:hypothetical protein